MRYLSEGSPCPTEGCTGTLKNQKPEDCSCHIAPPCQQCVDAGLECPVCCEVFRDPPPPAGHAWRSTEFEGLMTAEPLETKWVFPNGEIFDWKVDSRSGSTMVYRGKYKGTVTTDEIREHFGDGTFGHRGPFFYPNGTWTYTKITD